jgi:hypothetical protein
LSLLFRAGCSTRRNLLSFDGEKLEGMLLV